MSVVDYRNGCLLWTIAVVGVGCGLFAVVVYSTVWPYNKKHILRLQPQCPYLCAQTGSVSNTHEISFENWLRESESNSHFMFLFV